VLQPKDWIATIHVYAVQYNTMVLHKMP